MSAFFVATTSARKQISVISPGGVTIATDDVTSWAYSRRHSLQSRGHVNGGETARVEKKAVHAATRISILPHDLAHWINAYTNVGATG